MDYISSKWTAFRENLPSAIAYLLIYYGRNALTVITIVATTMTLFSKTEKYTENEKAILPPLLYMVVLFLLFSSVNYYIPRYLLCIFPPFIITCIVLTEKGFCRFPALRNLAYVGLCATFLFFYFQPAKNGDIDWSPSIRTDLAMVRYCEKEGLQDKHIFATSVLRIDFQEEHAGYLSGGRFSNIQSEFDQDTEYCIFTGDENDEALFNGLKSTNKLVLIKRCSEKYAWNELYKVIK